MEKKNIKKTGSEEGSEEEESEEEGSEEEGSEEEGSEEEGSEEIKEKKDSKIENSKNIDKNQTIKSKISDKNISNIQNNKSKLSNNDKNDPKSSWVIKISNVEFAKDFNYFITCELYPETIKRRTEVSSCISTPIFKTNTFIFPMSKYFIQEESNIKICGWIVIDKELYAKQENEPKGYARLLGEWVINLKNFQHLLTDISEAGVREPIKLLKTQKDQSKITVGRMLVDMKLVGEDIIPNKSLFLNDTQINNKVDLDKTDIVRPLPITDLETKFNRRIRVDIRSAIDLILDRTEDGLPTIQVELGLTDSENNKPELFNRFLTKTIESDRSPIFNQQFLLSSDSNEKSLYISVVNKNNELIIDEFFIPIDLLSPFYPYNFEFKSSKKEYKAPGYIYISIILEELTEDNELYDIVVNDINFDPPLVDDLNRMMIALTKDEYVPEKIIEFISIDLSEENSIENSLTEENNSNNKPIYYSSILKIPSIKIENFYKAICLFCLPKKFISSKLCFFICLRNKENKSILNLMPNDKTGKTDFIDDIITEQLETKTEVKIPIQWLASSDLYSVTSKSSNSMLNFLCHKLIFKTDIKEISNNIDKDESKSKTFIENSINKEKYINIMKQNLKSILTIKDEKEKWDLLSKELSQKQEITHRLLKDFDEKSENLRILGEEITDLRKQLKVIQSENISLKKKLNIEEKIEIQKFITKEVAEMSGEELKIRLIRAAQLYRDEKNRNDEFEVALHKAHRDLLKVKELEKEYEKLQQIHKEKSNKLLDMQDKLNKANLYKQTILDQEKVISKLERLLEISIKNSDKTQKQKLELDKVITENLKLEIEIKNCIKGSGNVDELLDLKKNVKNLEKIRDTWKNDLFNKRPKSSKRQDIEKEKIELDINIEKLETRVESLQNELDFNNKKYAKEIIYYQGILEEKQKLLDEIIK